MPAQDTLIVELVLGVTNDELAAKMRVMKAAREGGAIRHVACVVSGFGNDPRELHAIPEVRALCRRLVTTGFISYLDLATTSPLAARHLSGALGAMEVWLWSEGILPVGGKYPMTQELFDRANAAYLKSNAAADQLVGLFRNPT